MLAIAIMELAAPEIKALGLDPDAFRAVYEEALPCIYGYLLHRCGGDVAAAEDLTQETFLAIVTDLRKGRRVDTSLPWLYGIARHKLLDHFRRQARDERFVANEDGADLEDVALDVSGERARERTAAALAGVPASQRVTLILRYLDGFSVLEVAAALDKSVEAVESLLARGRTSFKRAYLEASP